MFLAQTTHRVLHACGTSGKGCDAEDGRGDQGRAEQRLWVEALMPGRGPEASLSSALSASWAAWISHLGGAACDAEILGPTGSRRSEGRAWKCSV